MQGAPGVGAPIERILPDGCVEAVFHQEAAFRAFDEDGQSCPQPRSLVVGPATRFLLIQPPPRVRTIGIRFRPAGARLLLPMPVDEIAGRVASIDDLLGSAGRRLAASVGVEAGAGAAVRSLEAAMLARLRRRPERGGAPIRPMAGAILRSRGRLPVAEVARRAGVSPRQLERRFLDEVGLTAKALARLARFQSVFGTTSDRADLEWAGVAFDCGYADQAHLIREFREFSGETPRTLQRSQGDLSRRFTSPDRLRAFFAAG
jgi:AraC-like DNA-binding protein